MRSGKLIAARSKPARRATSIGGATVDSLGGDKAATGAGDSATRLENRIGEPAANPYLYFASQIYSGLDGMARKLPLPPSADTPYEAKADLLPRTLEEALGSLLQRTAPAATGVVHQCRAGTCPCGWRRRGERAPSTARSKVVIVELELDFEPDTPVELRVRGLQAVAVRVARRLPSRWLAATIFSR